MIRNRDLFLDRTMPENFTIQLNHCGIPKCVPGCHYGFIMRSYHLIHFILNGSGALRINNQTYKLHKGQAFFTGPYQKQK